ncbi:MAG: hypothetical protein EVA89_29825 [Sandaracinaceae bacterium]|nr:MAG: hypothetical protein EVA89_29825 [Sandaracinaceae bacterium]
MTRSLLLRAASPLLVLLVLTLGAAAALAEPSGPVPDTPSRQAVVEAMNRVTPAVQACSNGWVGRAQVRFVFEGSSGRALSAQVVTPDVPTTVARCVEAAAQNARVPRFGRENFSVSFPFRLP